MTPYYCGANGDGGAIVVPPIVQPQNVEIPKFPPVSPPPPLPVLDQVVYGALQSLTHDHTMTLTQTTPTVVADYKSFNIADGYGVDLHQPSTEALAVFRVNKASGMSTIDGRFSANGNVLLLNPNGLLIGEKGVIDMNSFVATTHSDYHSGVDAHGRPFLQLDGIENPNASITNRGAITVGDSGAAVFASPITRNYGAIFGRASFVAGEKTTITFDGSDIVQFEVSGKLERAIIEQKGRVVADGKEVLLSTSATEHFLDTHMINMDGIVVGSKITIEGGDNSQVTVGPDAHLDTNGEKGGEIRVLGDDITLKGGALLEASGKHAGGRILVGGARQGLGPEKNAKTLMIEDGVHMNADSWIDGDGGEVINYADNKAILWGIVSASALGETGDGGFIEYSGKKSLDFPMDMDHMPRLRSYQGKGGMFLIDPSTVNIYGPSYASGGLSARNTAKNITTSTLLTSQAQLLNDLSSDTFSIGDTWINTIVNATGDLTIAATGSITIESDAVINFSTQKILRLSAETINVGPSTMTGGTIILQPDSGTTVTFDALTFNVIGSLTIGGSTIGGITTSPSISATNTITFTAPSITGALIADAPSIVFSQTPTLTGFFRLNTAPGSTGYALTIPATTPQITLTPNSGVQIFDKQFLRDVLDPTIMITSILNLSITIDALTASLIQGFLYQGINVTTTGSSTITIANAIDTQSYASGSPYPTLSFQAQTININADITNIEDYGVGGDIRFQGTTIQSTSGTSTVSGLYIHFMGTSSTGTINLTNISPQAMFELHMMGTTSNGSYTSLITPTTSPSSVYSMSSNTFFDTISLASGDVVLTRGSATSLLRAYFNNVRSNVNMLINVNNPTVGDTWILPIYGYANSDYSGIGSLVFSSKNLTISGTSTQPVALYKLNIINPGATILTNVQVGGSYDNGATAPNRDNMVTSFSLNAGQTTGTVSMNGSSFNAQITPTAPNYQAIVANTTINIGGAGISATEDFTIYAGTLNISAPFASPYNITYLSPTSVTLAGGTILHTVPPTQSNILVQSPQILINGTFNAYGTTTFQGITGSTSILGNSGNFVNYGTSATFNTTAISGTFTASSPANGTITLTNIPLLGTSGTDNISINAGGPGHLIIPFSISASNILGSGGTLALGGTIATATGTGSIIISNPTGTSHLNFTTGQSVILKDSTYSTPTLSSPGNITIQSSNGGISGGTLTAETIAFNAGTTGPYFTIDGTTLTATNPITVSGYDGSTKSLLFRNMTLSGVLNFSSSVRMSGVTLTASPGSSFTNILVDNAGSAGSLTINNFDVMSSSITSIASGIASGSLTLNYSDGVTVFDLSKILSIPQIFSTITIGQTTANGNRTISTPPNVTGAISVLPTTTAGTLTVSGTTSSTNLFLNYPGNTILLTGNSFNTVTLNPSPNVTTIFSIPDATSLTVINGLNLIGVTTSFAGSATVQAASTNLGATSFTAGGSIIFKTLGAFSWAQNNSVSNNINSFTITGYNVGGNLDTTVGAGSIAIASQAGGILNTNSFTALSAGSLNITMPIQTYTQGNTGTFSFKTTGGTGPFILTGALGSLTTANQPSTITLAPYISSGTDSFPLTAYASTSISLQYASSGTANNVSLSTFSAPSVTISALNNPFTFGSFGILGSPLTNLTVSGSGNLTFGNIYATTIGMTGGSSSTITLAGAIQTNGLTINTSATLTPTINITGTINGLSQNSGTINLYGSSLSIFGNLTLQSLVTQMSGNIAISNADIKTTTGNISFTAGGSITTSSASGLNVLETTTGPLILSAGTALTIGHILDVSNLSLNNLSIPLVLNGPRIGKLVPSPGNTLSIIGGTSNITLGSALINFGTINLSTSGNIAFQGTSIGNGSYSPVSITANTINMSTRTAGSTILLDTAASITTSALNINCPGGLAQGPYPAITLNGKIDGAATLNLYGTTIAIGGQLGQTTPITSLAAQASTSLAFTGSSLSVTTPTTFSVPTITISGTNIFTGQYAFTSSGNTTVSGIINTGMPLTFSAGTFSLGGLTTMNGPSTVTVNGGNITIGSNLTTAGDLVLTATTTLAIAGNITAYDGVNYHQITLTGGTAPSSLQGIITGTTLSLNGSDFSLASDTTLSASTSLILNGIHLTGASPTTPPSIAPTGPWPSLTITAPNTDFNNANTLHSILRGTFNNITLIAGDIVINNTPATYFVKGVMSLDGNNTTISGASGSLVSINSAGNIIFMDPLTIDPGLQGVTMTTTNGTVNFTGNVIANSPLTINASGTITFGGGLTSNGPSILNFTSTGGDVVFASSVTTSNGLTVSGRNIIFNGTLGTSLSPLQGILSLTATNNITLFQDVYSGSAINLSAQSVILGGTGTTRMITATSLITPTPIQANAGMYFDVASSITRLMLNTNGPINLSCFASGAVQTVTSSGGFLLSGTVNAGTHAAALTLNGPLTAQNTPSLSLGGPLTLNGIISATGQNLTLTTPVLTFGGTISANTLTFTTPRIFLSGNTTITSSSPLVLPLVDSIGQTPYSLTVTAPTLTFSNTLGGFYALNSLSATTTAGALTLTLGTSFNIIGNRTLTAATTINNLTTGHLSGGGLTTLISSRSLTLPAVGLPSTIGALDLSGVSGQLTLTGDIMSRGLVYLPANTNFGSGRTIAAGGQGIMIASSNLIGTGVLTLSGPVTFLQSTNIPGGNGGFGSVSFTSPTISASGNLTVNTPMNTTGPTTLSVTGNLGISNTLTLGGITTINTTGNFNIGTIVGQGKQLTLNTNTPGNILPGSFGALKKLTVSIPDILNLGDLINHTVGQCAFDLTGSAITVPGGGNIITSGLWLRSPVLLSGGNVAFEVSQGPIEFHSSINWNGQAYNLSITQYSPAGVTLNTVFSNNPSANISIGSVGPVTISGTVNTPGDIGIGNNANTNNIEGNATLIANRIFTGPITGSGSLTVQDTTSFSSGPINMVGGSFTRRLHNTNDITSPITACTVKLWVPSTDFTSNSKVIANTLWLIPITGGRGFSIEAPTGDSPLPFNFKVDSLINPNLFSIGSTLKIGDPNNLEPVYLKGFMNINTSIYLYGNIIVYGGGFLVGKNGQLVYSFGSMTQSPQQRDMLSTINDYVAKNSPSPVANIVSRMATSPVEESPLQIIPDLSEIPPATSDVNIKGGSVRIKNAERDDEDDGDEDEEEGDDKGGGD